MVQDIKLTEIESYIKKARKILVSNDLLMAKTQVSKKDLRRAIRTIPERTLVEIDFDIESGFLFITYPSNRGITRRQDWLV